MKKVLVAILLLLPTQVFAGEIFSGNIGVSSDYLWRGYSQNSGNVAVSGGVGADLGIFTMGVWASQVDFDDEAKFEYDLFAGVSHNFNDSFGVNAGYIKYKWDKGYDDVDEAYIGMNMWDLDVTYYKDLDNSELDFIHANYSIPFIEKVDVSLEYGKATGFDSYQALNISKQLGNYVIGGQIGSEETNIALYYNF
jgi:uncharacterized protein (TIGR02001 family)